MRARSIGSAVAVAFMAVLAAGGCRQQPADLVVLGGTIVTMDRFKPTAEALAARGDLIVAVGSEDEVSSLIGPETRVLDLAGAVAVPGLIDAHGHFLSLGRSQMQLDLREAADWPAIVAMVAEAAAAKNRPISWCSGARSSPWIALSHRPRGSPRGAT